jgi:ribose transport system ATP-binding protein
MLALTNISKSFGATRAVNGVSLTAHKGMVLGLVGENGAGKSTLIKIAGGAVAPDEGGIELGGTPIAPRTTRAALDHGIASVFQELTVLRDLTVEQNLFLTNAPMTPWRTVGRRALRRAANEILRRYRLEIAAGARVADLPLGQQQMLEIVRAVERNPQVLLLDEATSALGAVEVEWLIGIVRDMRDRGCIILFISHRWDEIPRFCSHVAIMRNGELVAVTETGMLSEAEAVRLMTGRTAADGYYPPKIFSEGAVAVRGKELRSTVLDGVDFSVRGGEILGLGGLVGQGQGALLEIIFGLERPISGRLTLNGSTHVPVSPRQSIDVGLAYVPQDRKSEGLLLEKGVGPNLTLAILRTLDSLIGIVRDRSEEALVLSAMNRAKINARGPAMPVGQLSGGNQQKVLLEKWLLTEPRVLLLNDVTRGVDVGTKQHIYEVISQIARRGIAVIWYSTDARELVGVAHRVLVMLHGRVSAELAGEDLEVDRIVHAAVVGASGGVVVR